MKWRAPLWAAIAVAIAVYQLGPMLNAGWELFDDGATLAWAAPGSKLRMRDVPSVLLHQTEVGDFGNTPRYRPVYYAVRVGEFAALGPSSHRWHAARMAMFASMIFLIFVAFDVWLGAWVGAALTIFVVANWYWQDVWLHLGPAEGVGMVGLSIFALGAALTTRGELRAAAWLTAVGTAIAVGSKESFLPLILPCLLVLEWVRRRSPRKRETVALEILAATMTVAVTLSTALFALRVGTDQYAHPVSSVSRVSWLWGRWGLALAAALALPPALSAAGWRALPTRLQTDAARESWLRQIRAFRAVVWCSAALVAFQLFIYSPVWSWPTWASRYDVPGRLASSALIGASLVLAQEFLTMCGRGAVMRWVRVTAVVVLLLIARREFPWALRGAAIRQADYSHRLDARLNGLAAALGKNPGTPLVVRWNSGAENEAFGATLQLLRQRGIDGPFFLTPEPAMPRADTSVFAQWGAEMRDMSARGATWYGAAVLPWREFSERPAANRDAIEVQLNAYDVPAWRFVRAER